MKKSVILFLVAVVAIGAAFGQALPVTGTVTQVLETSLVSGALNLTLAGAAGATVPSSGAVIKIRSNRPQWTVTFLSSNDGFLNPTEGFTNASAIAYKLRATWLSGTVSGTIINGLVDAAGVTLSDVAGPSISTTGNGKTSADGLSYTLNALVVLPASDVAMFEANAGLTYTDTITVTIAAN